MPIAAQETTYSNSALAPGWTKLSFEAPEPASTLSSYQPATNGSVVDSNGTALNLHEILTIKLSCLILCTAPADVNGCPLATAEL